MTRGVTLASVRRCVAERTATDEEVWLLARVEGLAKALRPFAAFAEKFDAKPIRGLDDRLYGIYTGTEWEAELRLSECRAARAQLAALEEAR